MLQCVISSLICTLCCHNDSVGDGDDDDDDDDYDKFIICPIAIAYSRGQIIKPVCVYACLCVCPSVRTLTVTFLHRFSLNWHRGSNTPKVRMSLLGSVSHHPFPYFAPKNPYFRPF